MCKDCWFSKYNKVFFHYSVSIAAAAVYIPLSVAVVVVVVVVDTHHCSVDTDELFHAYFFYVST
jgi:hypothetical protein